MEYEGFLIHEVGDVFEVWCFGYFLKAFHDLDEAKLFCDGVID
jgi:hypothetical protein